MRPERMGHNTKLSKISFIFGIDLGKTGSSKRL